MRHTAIILAIALSSGCKSEVPASGSAPSATATASATAQALRSFQGTYSVERITQQGYGCDMEGRVVDPHLKFLYLKYNVNGGRRDLSGGAQTTLAKCIQLSNHFGTVFHPVAMTEAVDGAEPRGTAGRSIFDDGTCRGSAEEHLVRWTGPDEIRVEIRETKVEFPGKDVMDCGPRKAIAAAVGKPCSKWTVIRARFHQPLPDLPRDGG